MDAVRQMDLRWGLGMGAAAGALGALGLLIGVIIEPFKSFTTPEVMAFALFVRGVIVLLVLGVVLGMAYYAGLRLARDRRSGSGALAVEGRQRDDGPDDRMAAVFTGGLVTLCYWIITTLYLILFPTSPQSPGTQNQILPLLESRLIFGVICVLLGAGLGGLGARAVAARKILDQIAVAPSTSATPSDAPRAASGGAESAKPDE